MFELIKVANSTYYIKHLSRVGIYVDSDSNATIIDTSTSEAAGVRVLRHLYKNNWRAKMIINTHTHADHIGGNSVIMETAQIPAYAPDNDVFAGNQTYMEATAFFGGCPFDKLLGEYAAKRPANVQPISEISLPESFEIENVDGHTYGMCAIKTPDDVWFIGDTVIGETFLNNHGISFIWDISGALKSIEKLKTLKGRLFIPSHAEPVEDIVPLADFNRNKILEAADWIADMCSTPRGVDWLVAQTFNRYSLTPTTQTSVLNYTIVRSYLAYLYSLGRVEIVFDKGEMLWHSV